VDYYPVQLLHIPPGSTLIKALQKEGAVYVAHDEPLRQLRNESGEAERVRWCHIPLQVFQRGRDGQQGAPWYV
jgi:hypothetical protein